MQTKTKNFRTVILAGVTSIVLIALIIIAAINSGYKKGYSQGADDGMLLVNFLKSKELYLNGEISKKEMEDISKDALKSFNKLYNHYKK